MIDVQLIKRTSAFKFLASAEAGVLIKTKHYCKWSAHQREHGTGKELVPSVLETSADIHLLAVGYIVTQDLQVCNSV